MSPLAKSTFATAQRRLELACALLEEAADSGFVDLVGQAYAAVLLARGELSAALQVLELETTLSTADTERPPHLPPRLMLVRR